MWLELILSWCAGLRRWIIRSVFDRVAVIGLADQWIEVKGVGVSGHGDGAVRNVLEIISRKFGVEKGCRVLKYDCSSWIVIGG